MGCMYFSQSQFISNWTAYTWINMDVMCLKLKLYITSNSQIMDDIYLFYYKCGIQLCPIIFLLIPKEPKLKYSLTQMNLPNFKLPKVFKTMSQAHLLIVQYWNNQIQFTIFNQSHQEVLERTQFLLIDLKKITQQQKRYKPLCEVFQDIKCQLQQSIAIQKNRLILNVRIADQNMFIPIELSLTATRLKQAQSISYLKEFYRAKDQLYKSEILKLKSKIYCLMTQVEDATFLIKSQYTQTRSSKQQVKNLKKQLIILQEQRKKQQETTFSEVGVQHDNLQDTQDSIQCLQTPQVKQFYLDKERLKGLALFIQQQIRQNEKILLLTDHVFQKNIKEVQRTLSQTRISTGAQTHPKEVQSVKLSPQRVYLFEKSNLFNFRPEACSLRTLELS